MEGADWQCAESIQFTLAQNPQIYFLVAPSLQEWDFAL
jgi:hypothetical protein